MFSILTSIVEGFFGSLWKTLFPPKTAADQKIDDLTAANKEATDANHIAQKVDQESDAQLNADLAKRVRKPD